MNSHGRRRAQKFRIDRHSVAHRLKGVSAIQVAEQLLKKFETLDNLSRATIEDLRQVKGIGRDKAIALKSAFTLARRMVLEIRQESPTLDNPERIADLLREENRAYEVESFQVVLLNTRRRLIRVENIARHTRPDPRSSPRRFQKRDRSQCCGVGVGAQSSQRRSHSFGSGHQSDARSDSRGPIFENRSAGSHYTWATSNDRPKDYASLWELGYFYT